MSIAFILVAGFGYFYFTHVLWDGMLRYGKMAVTGARSPRLTTLAVAILIVCTFHGFCVQYIRIMAWGAEWAGLTN